jgi:hypothetical protein
VESGILLEDVETGRAPARGVWNQRGRDLRDRQDYTDTSFFERQRTTIMMGLENEE